MLHKHATASMSNLFGISNIIADILIQKKTSIGVLLCSYKTGSRELKNLTDKFSNGIAVN